MASFECNRIEDLLFNEYFRGWVLDKQSVDADFWNSWIAQNPDKLEMVNHATAIICALQVNFYTLSQQQMNEEIAGILAKPGGKYDQILAEGDKPSQPRFRRLNFWARAAILLVGALFSWMLFQRSFRKTKDVYQRFIAAGNDLVVQTNLTGTKKLIRLTDGSLVYLENNSTLTYHKLFGAGKREVYLKGQAFFEVAKDVANPFLVYTSSLTTRVLGTSFTVKAWSEDKIATVTVVTGKVSVFKNDNFQEPGDFAKASGGVLVTPNQQIIYNNDVHDLNKVLVQKPLPVVLPSDPKEFVFNATPAALVFRRLQDEYGIQIVFDQDALAGCSLSATLGDEPFYDKIDLICNVLDATYEVVDGNIFITSKGCK